MLHNIPLRRCAPKPWDTTIHPWEQLKARTLTTLDPDEAVEQWFLTYVSLPHQIACLSDIYTVIHSSSKTYNYKVAINDFTASGHHSVRNYTKGSWHQEGWEALPLSNTSSLHCWREWKMGWLWRTLSKVAWQLLTRQSCGSHWFPCNPAIALLLFTRGAGSYVCGCLQHP